MTATRHIVHALCLTMFVGSASAQSTPAQRLEAALREDGAFLRARARLLGTLQATPALRDAYAQSVDSVSVHVHSGRPQVVTDFRDPSHRVEIPPAPHLDYRDAVSISIWLWLDAESMLRDTKIVSHAGVADGKITLMGDRRRVVVVIRHQDGARTQWRVRVELPRGRWAHVGVAFESGRDPRVYVDGVQQPLSLVHGTPSRAPVRSLPEQPMYVGGLDRAFPGRLDDLRVYGRALDAAAFMQLQEGVDLRNALLGHWPLDEPEGSVVRDTTPHANHGTAGASVVRDRGGWRGGCMDFGRNRGRWIRELLRLESKVDSVVARVRDTLPHEDFPTLDRIRDALRRHDAVLAVFEDPSSVRAHAETLRTWVVDSRRQGVLELSRTHTAAWHAAREALRSELRAPRRRRTDVERRRHARIVARELWDPIARHIGPDREVWLRLTPDLHDIPFAALVDADGRDLLDDYAFARCGPLARVARRAIAEPSQGTRRMVALTNPMFGALKHDVAVPEPPRTQSTADTRRGLDDATCIVEGQPLLGTRREVDAVVPLLRRAGFESIEVYEWTRAQEHTLDDVVRDADVVHVATHGYQIAPSCMARAPRDPLHTNGVVLAGAVRIVPDGFRGSHDGLLSAAEVADWNLTRTRLLVWSGCATATGETLPAEPLSGLAAAGWLAGARASVATLWSVSDQTMPLQIEAFYRAWLTGVSEARALQEALRAGRMLRSATAVTGIRRTGHRSW